MLGTSVETWSRSTANISLVPEGPALPRELVPYMVLMTRYTEGDVKV